MSPGQTMCHSAQHFHLQQHNGPYEMKVPYCIQVMLNGPAVRLPLNAISVCIYICAGARVCVHLGCQQSLMGL